MNRRRWSADLVTADRLNRTGDKNILFSSIFDLTVLFHGVAEKLVAEGHRVFWITTDQRWTDWLASRGIDRDNICELVYTRNEAVHPHSMAAIKEQIVGCERRNDLTVNQLMLMDRFARVVPEVVANRYMYLYYRDIKNFLLSRRIDVVFAEPTNANELLTAMICRELGIPFLAPRDMRFPLGRLIFNSGYRADELIGGEGCGGAEDASRLLSEYKATRPTPYYFEKLKRSRVVTSSYVARSTRNRITRVAAGHRHGLTHHRLSSRARVLAGRVINGFYLRHLYRYDKLNDIQERLAFYPLHVQPEASIDVLGPYVSDQLNLIKDIRRALPFNMTLLVKEHPNFLGLKGRRFFRELKQLPNVKLIRHDVSNFEVYKQASLVLTVSGTPAYEAALLGIPAITFAPMYFGKLSSVHHCPDITGLKDLIQSTLRNNHRDIEHDIRAMAEMLAHSYDAYWTDPVFDRCVLDEANLTKLAVAFNDVVRQITTPAVKRMTGALIS
ncbi:MAG: hypothetical protein AB1644_00365 [Candidatus Zixiibacteriota bacterium]